MSGDFPWRQWPYFNDGPCAARDCPVCQPVPSRYEEIYQRFIRPAIVGKPLSDFITIKPRYRVKAGREVAATVCPNCGNRQCRC